MPIALTTETPSTARAAPANSAPSTSPASTEGMRTESVTQPRTKDEATVAAAKKVVPTPPIANWRAARFNWRQMRAAPGPRRLGAAVEPRFTTSEGIVAGLPTSKPRHRRPEHRRDLCRHPSLPPSPHARGAHRPPRRALLGEQGRGRLVGLEGAGGTRGGPPRHGGPRVPGRDRLAASPRTVGRIGRSQASLGEEGPRLGRGCRLRPGNAGTRHVHDDAPRQAGHLPRG